MVTPRKLFVSSPDDGSGGIATFYAQFDVQYFDKLDIKVVSANPYRPKHMVRPSWQTLPTALQIVLTAAEAGFADDVSEPVDILEVCDSPLNCAPAILRQDLPYVVQCHGSIVRIAEHDPQTGSEMVETMVQLIEPQLLRAAHRIQTSSRSTRILGAQDRALSSPYQACIQSTAFTRGSHIIVRRARVRASAALGGTSIFV